MASANLISTLFILSLKLLMKIFNSIRLRTDSPGTTFDVPLRTQSKPEVTIL